MSLLMVGSLAWERLWHPERFNIKRLNVILNDGEKRTYSAPGRVVIHQGWLLISEDEDRMDCQIMINTDKIQEIEVDR